MIYKLGIENKKNMTKISQQESQNQAEEIKELTEQIKYAKSIIWSRTRLSPHNRLKWVSNWWEKDGKIGIIEDNRFGTTTLRADFSKFALREMVESFGSFVNNLEKMSSEEKTKLQKKVTEHENLSRWQDQKIKELIQNIIELEAEVSKLNQENKQLKEQNDQYIAQIETKK